MPGADDLFMERLLVECEAEPGEIWVLPVRRRWVVRVDGEDFETQGGRVTAESTAYRWSNPRVRKPVPTNASTVKVPAVLNTITGGTGEFENVRGTVHVEPMSNNEDQLTLTLIP